MRHRFLLEAITPISHFDTRTGVDNGTNMRLGMTQPILLNGRRVYCPHTTENMLRSVLFRVPLADHLVATLGVAGQLPRPVLNLLYAGGAMGGGARAPGDETALGHAIGKLYPSLALLGGAVDAFILPRSKLRMSAWLVAQEYLTAIAAIFPEEADRAKSVSAFDLLGDEVRTRGTGDEASGNQMLYGYQALAAGTHIAVELITDRWISPEAESAIGRAIAEWPGYIGGQARQGRGRCVLHWLGDKPSPDAYDAHIGANADAMRDGIASGTLGAPKAVCAA